jgi:hypothetical protein
MKIKLLLRCVLPAAILFAFAGDAAARIGLIVDDTVPPRVAISEPAAGANVTGTLTVAVTASDDVQVAAVEVKVDSGSYKPATNANGLWTVMLDTAGYANGDHTLTARATDSSGNRAWASRAVTFQNSARTSDLQPPTISIEQPAGGSTVQGAFTVAGSAADDLQLETVEVRVDEGAYRLATGTSAWALSIDSGAYGEGTHIVRARATDSSGNRAWSSVALTFQKTSDTKAPTISIVSPESGTVGGIVAVAGIAADDAAVSKVEVKVDGGGYQTASGTVDWSLSLDTTKYGDGSHTLTARATDSSGNTTETSTTVNFDNGADTVPPTVVIAVPASGATVGGVVTVSGVAVDDYGVALVEVRVDGGAYQAASGTTAWSVQIDTRGFADGSHTLTARASDAAGNKGWSSVNVRFANGSGGSVYWGAYMDGEDTYDYYYGGSWHDAPWDRNTWSRFESNTGKRVSLVHWGMGTIWSHDFQFFVPSLNLAQNAGDINFVDLSTGTVALKAIGRGDYDPVLRKWAQQAAAWGHPFLLALDVEMNGYWEPYGTMPPAQNTAADFVAAWRRFHDIATSAGATNITWAWVPNIDITHRFTPYQQLYPGDAYVDWTGLDGFNWGASAWMTFSQIFTPNYQELLQLAPTKPIVLSQTASAEAGGNKANWITDMLTTQLPHNFPQVKAFLWFNWRIYEKGIWQPWPIESSPTAKTAFATAIKANYYAPGGSFRGLPRRTKVPIP